MFEMFYKENISNCLFLETIQGKVHVESIILLSRSIPSHVGIWKLFPK